MEVTREDAQESLAAVEAMMQKVRRAVADGGTHYFLILWGVIWFLGFLGSQFLPDKTAGLIWLGLDVLGSLASFVIGLRLRRRIRDSGGSPSAQRLAFFWLTLFTYCLLNAWIVWPLNSKQMAMVIILFAMLGYLAMGFLMSIAIVKLALFVTAVACGAYLLPGNYFFLGMALLGGGTMIGSGLYIRSKWRQS